MCRLPGTVRKYVIIHIFIEITFGHVCAYVYVCLCKYDYGYNCVYVQVNPENSLAYYSVYH